MDRKSGPGTVARMDEETGPNRRQLRLVQSPVRLPGEEDEELLARSVIDALAGGMSWEQIGTRLGVAAPTAYGSKATDRDWQEAVVDHENARQLSDSVRRPLAGDWAVSVHGIPRHRGGGGDAQNCDREAGNRVPDISDGIAVARDTVDGGEVVR